jgi:hypothetical protein
VLGKKNTLTGKSKEMTPLASRRGGGRIILK